MRYLPVCKQSKTFQSSERSVLRSNFRSKPILFRFGQLRLRDSERRTSLIAFLHRLDLRLKHLWRRRTVLLSCIFQTSWRLCSWWALLWTLLAQIWKTKQNEPGKEPLLSNPLSCRNTRLAHEEQVVCLVFDSLPILWTKILTFVRYSKDLGGFQRRRPYLDRLGTLRYFLC